jgi:GrpB-like predicted nucleotidyltransferase (UPF0157 family)
MAEHVDNGRVPATKAILDAVTVGGARPHGGPVYLSEYDPAWPELFAKEAARIARLLGETTFRIEHIGSTSVPGLAAKPVIDIVMAVVDSSDEASYVAPLEMHGYELRIRDPDWFEHRVLKGPDTDVNLHVFTMGCPEVDRMIRFRDRLRGNADDRRRYEAAKRELAKRDWEFIQNYADAKSEVIEQIIARASKAGN